MKKALKIVFIVIASILSLFILSGIIVGIFVKPTERNKSVSINPEIHAAAKKKLDSTIAAIKVEKEFKVDSIIYTQDSILKVYVRTSKTISANYFDVMYDVFKIGNVSEIELYKKGKLESTFGYHTEQKIQGFKSSFISSWDGSCRPVESYIKKTMHDPDSYKHESTVVYPLVNGNFTIETKFRGKNGFGALVLNSAVAEVSGSGQIISFDLQ
jgi:uncharacterized protein YneF (UPF0154 family)